MESNGGGRVNLVTVGIDNFSCLWTSRQEVRETEGKLFNLIYNHIKPFINHLLVLFEERSHVSLSWP